MVGYKKTFAGLSLAMMMVAPAAVMAQSATVGAEAPLRAMTVTEETGLRVTMGEITDSRTTGKNFARLDVELKTEGEGLSQAFGAAKPVITAAVDDTGRSLMKDEKKLEPIFWSFQVFDKPQSSINERVELLNPARKATSVSFVGYADVLNPQHDPDSIYVVKDLAALAGKPLLPEAFQKAGLEITAMTKPLVDKMKQEKAQADAAQKAALAAQVKEAGAQAAGQAIGQAAGQAFGKMFESMFSGFFSMSENDVLFVVKDPKRQIAVLQLIDAAGVPLKTGGGRSMSQDEAKGTVNYTLSLASALPAGAQLKIYFATPKSMQRIPFKYESVRLP